MNLRGAVIAWRQGRHFGYPRCCILHYCLDTLLERPPQGMRRHREGWPCVPCRFHAVRVAVIRQHTCRYLNVRIWEDVAVPKCLKSCWLDDILAGTDRHVEGITMQDGRLTIVSVPGARPLP